MPKNGAVGGHFANVYSAVFSCLCVRVCMYSGRAVDMTFSRGARPRIANFAQKRVSGAKADPCVEKNSHPAPELFRWFAFWIAELRAQIERADSTQKSSKAAPSPSNNRALRCLASEVERDPAHSARYGRRRTDCLARPVLVRARQGLSSKLARARQCAWRERDIVEGAK